MSKSCWRSLGVWGDRSCGELTQVLHCRNCPVFVEAGRQRFDRPLEAKTRAERTELLSRPIEPDSEQEHSAMVFQAGGELLALPTTVFVEVMGSVPIHPVPHRQSLTFMGLVNVRGRLRPCFSLPAALGFEALQDRRMLVAHHGERTFVLPVEQVRGMVRFPQRELKEPPSTLPGEAARFTLGIFPYREQMVALLEPSSLLKGLFEGGGF